MRLIDADELNAIKEKLRIFDSFISTVTRQCTDEHQAIYEHWIDCRYDIENIIDKLPTAYDVSKVVAELEQYATSPICKMHKVGCPYRNNDNIACENCGALGAIDIVRKGGVSDDVCEWRLCDEEANVYDTSCRNPHILIEGTPKENNYEYCPYCGKKIKVVE